VYAVTPDVVPAMLAGQSNVIMIVAPAVVNVPLAVMSDIASDWWTFILLPAIASVSRAVR
jgi:hypothetical protein